MMNFGTHWHDWKELYGARNEPENIRPLAELYWRALLGIGLVLIGCIIAWGVWVFVSVITNLGASTPTTASPAILLDRNQLQSTIAGFEARKSAFGSASAAHATVPDPSR